MTLTEARPFFHFGGTWFEKTEVRIVNIISLLIIYLKKQTKKKVQRTYNQIEYIHKDPNVYILWL